MNGGPMLAPAHLARASAALGEGRHDDAFQHLWPVFDKSDPTLTATDEPGFWETNGYHNHGEPWLEQRYQGD